MTAEGEGPHRRRGTSRRPHGQTHPRGRAGEQQVHPRALLHGGPLGGRRLPALHGRGVGRRPPAARLHDAGAGGPVGRRRLAAARSRTARSRSSCCSPSATTSARCASPRATASCSRWRRSSASPTSATRTTTRGCRSTRRTRATCSTTTAASSARAACASAPRSRAPTCGTSPARGIQSRLVCELNRPWGEAKTCTSCGKCVQACPTGAMAEKGCGVEEMTKQKTVVSRLTLDARRPLMEQGQDRHLLARRLLGLPHVAARHRRGHRRGAQEGRHRLRPARRRAGVPRGRRRDAGRGRGQQPGRPRSSRRRSARAARSWSRSATAR